MNIDFKDKYGFSLKIGDIIEYYPLNKPSGTLFTITKLDNKNKDFPIRVEHLNDTKHKDGLHSDICVLIYNSKLAKLIFNGF